MAWCWWIAGPNIPVISSGGDSISLLKAKLQLRQFKATLYPADFEECLVATGEELGASMCLMVI